MAKSKKQSLTWNLTPLLKSDSDPYIEKERKILKQQVNRFVKKWKDRDDYLKKPAVLKEALDEYEAWAAKYGVAGQQGYYFSLRESQEQSNSKIKAMDNQITEFATKLANEIQFFTMRVAKINPKLQAQFLSFKALAPYKHWLEKAFEGAKYLLSEDEEKIMNLKSSPAQYNWIRMTSSFINKEEAVVLTEQGKKKKLSFNSIISLINSRKKKVRDTAALAINQFLAKHVEVAENELNSILQDKKINDDLRGYSRPDQARHMSDDIPSKIVDAVSQAVAKNNAIAQRYYKLKAKLLKQKKLAYHERNVPVGEIKGNYDFDSAFTLVNHVFERLDPQFSAIITSYKQNRQIDVLPRKGKRGGAFCAHDMLNQPTYILLNHTNELKDVLYIAHECGHGINNELMREKQNAINFDTPLATAEVASTFMEDFVLQKLLAEADEETRLALLMEKLNDEVSSVFRQIGCYRFEQELHQAYRTEGYLSKDDIGKLFLKHMKAYMGGAVEQSPGSENWWVYWGHIRSFFYVYSYASGLLISKSLQAKVKADPAFINKVKEFLSAGTSDSPYNTFKKLGIDIGKASFWEQGLQEIAELLKEAEQLAKKLKKI